MESANSVRNILEEDNKYVFASLGTQTQKLKGARVLITGSRGFLGRTIVSFLEYLNKEQFAPEDQVDIIAIDYQDFDICEDLSGFIPEGTLDYIINCAGIASPKKYLKSPLKTLDVSYDGTKNVFNLAMLRKTKSIIMFSSSEVYGTPPEDQIPTPETHTGTVTTLGNRSCYDIGKNVLETLSYVYHTQYGSPVNILRPFNIYGPLMDLHDGRIIPNICKSMIAEGTFSVYGTGKQTRTYCYVADAMVYILSVLMSETYGEVYNIGSEDQELSALDIDEKAYAIANTANTGYENKPYPPDYPNEEPTRRCPDISKVKELSGHRPEYQFEKGFMSCLSYFESITNA